VKWKGYPISKASWEPEQAFSNDGNMLTEIKSILKKIPSDLITFEDIINKRIKLMQNSTEEYDKFLKLLDDLITIIDLTMDSTRLTVIKKTVCFAEHNKIFLIPPREFSPQDRLTNPFPDLFH